MVEEEEIIDEEMQHKRVLTIVLHFAVHSLSATGCFGLVRYLPMTTCYDQDWDEESSEPSCTHGRGDPSYLSFSTDGGGAESS